MKKTPQSKLSLRIFYKTQDSKKLTEFFGKHRDDIETIHSGINVDEPDVSKIIIFDGIREDGTYHDQMEFGLNGFHKMELLKEVRVNISGTQLDWLVKSSNS